MSDRKIDNTVKATWQSWSDDTTEELVLTESHETISIESTITSKSNDGFRQIKYRIVCDANLHTRLLEIKTTDTNKSLVLNSDGLGNWSGDSQISAQIAGAIEIDITATPFTNTLPIRRLKLAVNQSQDILVTYITTPELTVTLDKQRYTRISANRYRFEQLTTDFVCEIDVDNDGFSDFVPRIVSANRLAIHLIPTSVRNERLDSLLSRSRSRLS